MKLSYLFIAHNLAVVKHISDDIAVMYLGRMVEYADSEVLYAAPLHTYTQALDIGHTDPDPCGKRKRFLLAGDLPSPHNPLRDVISIPAARLRWRFAKQHTLN